MKTKILPIFFGLFLSTAAYAQSVFSFSIDDQHYVFLESTLHLDGQKNNQALVALWEISSAKLTERWKTIVYGCNSPIGTIFIQHTGGSSNYNWSWEGNRAYDLMAASVCAASLVKAKPLKRL